MAMDSYSLSDLAAATGNSGFGGSNWGGIVAGGLGGLLLGDLLNGNGGIFGGNRGQVATTEDLASGFNFQALRSKGNDILAAIGAEGRTTDNAICTLGYNTLQQSSALSAQMANCCCDLKTAVHAEGEATRNMIQQDKIEALQQQINALQLNAALCGVVRYPTAATYSVPGGCFSGCGTSCAY